MRVILGLLNLNFRELSTQYSTRIHPVCRRRAKALDRRGGDQGPTLRNLEFSGELHPVAQLAKVELAAAPACPNCRNRVTDLDLEALGAGAEHQCLFCGHFMRVPKAILDRLIAQRDASLAEQEKSGGWWSTLKLFWARIMGR